MEPAKNVQGGVRLGLGSTDNLRILTGLDLPIDIGIAQLKLLSRIHLLCLYLILFPFLLRTFMTVLLSIIIFWSISSFLLYIFFFFL